MLSTREVQIVVGIALGLTNEKIGETLGISQTTVKSHLQRVFKRVGVEDRASLVTWGYRVGMLQKLRPPQNPPADIKLTSREVEMIILVIQGFTNREIGKRVFLTENTVKTHLRKTFKKVGAKSRSHLITLAWQYNLVPHEAWETDDE